MVSATCKIQAEAVSTYTVQLTSSPSFKASVAKKLLFVPTVLPFILHVYTALESISTALAVKEVLFAAQIVSEAVVIAIEGSKRDIDLIVMTLDSAVSI